MPNRRVQTAADAVLAGHTHLHRAAALQRTAQSLAAQLTANQQELEKELQADEAENERAAKLIAEEKEALRTHLGQLQQELEAQPKQAISTSLQRDIEQAVAMRDDLKKVHKNLKALEASPHPPLARPPRLLKIASASAARCQPPPRPPPPPACSLRWWTSSTHSSPAPPRWSASSTSRSRGYRWSARWSRTSSGPPTRSGCGRRGRVRAARGRRADARRCVCICRVHTLRLSVRRCAGGAKARVLWPVLICNYLFL